MKQTICDRCGAIINEKECSYGIGNGLVLVKAKTRVLENWNTVDLCTRCRQSFLRWWNEKEAGVAADYASNAIGLILQSRTKKTQE